MRISDIIIWILFILTLIMVFWYIFGNSPSFEQTLLVLIINLLFTLSTRLVRVDMKIKMLEKRFTRLETSFLELAKDFKEYMTNN